MHSKLTATVLRSTGARIPRMPRIYRNKDQDGASPNAAEAPGLGPGASAGVLLVLLYCCTAVLLWGLITGHSKSRLYL